MPLKKWADTVVKKKKKKIEKKWNDFPVLRRSLIKAPLFI